MTTSASSEPPALGPLLSSIHSPEDVKRLAEADLPVLAEEVRHSLITSLSKTGGHLGPNLGVVELSIALHRVFSTPADNFVFDVAHQGYVHKMLTGRAEQIHTIRTYKGLNGFLLRSESSRRPIAPLNVMGLASPQSAILSAVIFNALVIIALIPLALKGVPYKPMGAMAVLRRNLLLYGLGGMVIPFACIKLIDLVVTTLHFV